MDEGQVLSIISDEYIFIGGDIVKPKIVSCNNESMRLIPDYMFL